MKLNLKQIFFNLKGEKIKNPDGTICTLGDILAMVVLNPNKQKNGFRPLKAWELAKKFTNNKEIELDVSEVVQIKEMLEEDESLHIAVRAQSLEYFIKADK